MTKATAFILAGGKSSRMGTEKAFVQFEGTTLLDRAIMVAKEAAGDVFICGSRQTFAPYGIPVEDIFPGQGPLAGIHAALNFTETDVNLILAVDMPFVDKKLLQFLVAEALQHEKDVTVPYVREKYEPLCAVYRRGFRRAAEQALKAGNNKVDALFDPLATHRIDEKALAKFGDPFRLFSNLNTPDEVRQAAAPGGGK